MPKQRVAVLLAATIAIVATTVLLIGSPVEATRSPTVTRSIGVVVIGTGGTLSVDASNFTGKPRSVTVTLRTPLGFTGSTAITQTIPSGEGRTFDFSCPPGMYCGAILVAKSSPRIVLDAHWTYNTVDYFVRPGDWAKV